MDGDSMILNAHKHPPAASTDPRHTHISHTHTLTLHAQIYTWLTCGLREPRYLCRCRALMNDLSIFPLSQ